MGRGKGKSRSIDSRQILFSPSRKDIKAEEEKETKRLEKIRFEQSPEGRKRARAYGPPTEIMFGKSCWKNNKGEFHRDFDLPAVLSEDDQEWWQNGNRHREGDKPAIISKGVLTAWYKDGVLHRDNGEPAVIEESGLKEWWVNGEFIRDDRSEES